MATKSETVDTGSTLRAGSNTLRFANYFASGTGEDNAGTEMTEVSTSGQPAETLGLNRQGTKLTKPPK